MEEGIKYSFEIVSEHYENGEYIPVYWRLRRLSDDFIMCVADTHAELAELVWFAGIPYMEVTLKMYDKYNML